MSLYNCPEECGIPPSLQKMQFGDYSQLVFYMECTYCGRGPGMVSPFWELCEKY